MVKGINNIKRIRKNAFSQNFEFDNELASLAGKNDKFFTSPLIQTIYNYQIDYLLNVSKYFFNNKPLKVLDWGCGRGHASYWLKKKSIDVLSCDLFNIIDKSLKEEIIKNDFGIDVILLRHDYKLPFPDSSFDVVLSFGVLEHVKNDNKSMEEINRILKSGGLFFCFYLPYKLSYTQFIEEFIARKGIHDRLYWKRTVYKLLKQNNFHIIDIWHRALFPKRRCFSKLFRIIDKIDNWLCNYSILKYFATNIEFCCMKSN